MASIVDSNKQQIVLVDSAGRRDATLPLNQLDDEFVRAMPEMPPEALAAMSSLKTAVESKGTGRTADIKGIQAVEKELVMTMEGPAMPNVTAGPLMRMVMQIWTPKSGESMRVPAIHEISGYKLASLAMINRGAAMAKMLQQMPGSSDLANLVKEMQNRGVILRMHSNVFMPGIAAAMPAGDSPFGAGFDADTPFIQIQVAVAELSTTPIHDSLFAGAGGVQERSGCRLRLGDVDEEPAASIREVTAWAHMFAVGSARNPDIDRLRPPVPAHARRVEHL